MWLCGTCKAPMANDGCILTPTCGCFTLTTVSVSPTFTISVGTTAARANKCDGPCCQPTKYRKSSEPNPFRTFSDRNAMGAAQWMADD